MSAYFTAGCHWLRHEICMTGNAASSCKSLQVPLAGMARHGHRCGSNDPNYESRLQGLSDKALDKGATEASRGLLHTPIKCRPIF